MTQLNETEFGIFLNEEIAALDNLTRPTWKKYKVKTESAKGAGDVPLMIVAKAGDEVLVYDSAREEFGAGVTSNGIVEKWTTYGPALRDALRHFPKH